MTTESVEKTISGQVTDLSYKFSSKNEEYVEVKFLFPGASRSVTARSFHKSVVDEFKAGIKKGQNIGLVITEREGEGQGGRKVTYRNIERIVPVESVPKGNGTFQGERNLQMEIPWALTQGRELAQFEYVHDLLGETPFSDRILDAARWFVAAKKALIAELSPKPTQDDAQASRDGASTTAPVPGEVKDVPTFWTWFRAKYGTGQEERQKAIEILDGHIVKWVEAEPGRSWQKAKERVQEVMDATESGTKGEGPDNPQLPL